MVGVGDVRGQDASGVLLVGGSAWHTVEDVAVSMRGAPKVYACDVVW